MSGTVDNLIQGSGFLYVADLGTTEPTDTNIHTPPASEDWTTLGFTRDGVTHTLNQEWSELEVDQLVDVPGRRLVKRENIFATNLAEPTLDNLRTILNAGSDSVTSETAGAGASGVKTFTPESNPRGEPNYRMLLFDGLAPSGFVRRVLVRRVLQIGNIGIPYQKDGQTMFPVEFHGHYVSSSVAPFKVVDQTATPTS